MTKTEQAVQAITLYHELLSDSDQNMLWEIANRALRKAVSAGKAQIVSTPVAVKESYTPIPSLTVNAPANLASTIKEARLAASAAEATRLIECGGVKVNGEVIGDKEHQLEEGTYEVQCGKRRKSTIIVEAA